MNYKLLIYLLVSAGLLAIAVINFIGAGNHWDYLTNYQLLPITKNFNIHTQWVLFLLASLGTLFMLFRTLNEHRIKKGLNKRNTRF